MEPELNLAHFIYTVCTLCSIFTLCTLSSHFLFFPCEAFLNFLAKLSSFFLAKLSSSSLHWRPIFDLIEEMTDQLKARSAVEKLDG